MANEDEYGFDDLLAVIGFGRWQVISLAVTITVIMTLPVHMTGSPLLSAPMPFRCSSDSTFSGDVPDLHTHSINEINESSSSSDTNSSKYFKNDCLKLNHSTETHNNNPSHPNLTRYATSMPSCPFIEYDTSVFSLTIISEHHLVCEKSVFQPLFQMMYSIGGMLGSIIGGHIGDRWGRKRAVQSTCLINIMAVLSMAFVPFYPLVLVMRIFTGFTSFCMLVTAWNMALESTPPKHRGLTGMLLGLPYSVSVAAFAGTAYLIRTWRYLLLASTFPALILLPLSYIVDESPRWLLVQGRVEETKTILQKAIKLNNAKLSDDLDSIMDRIIKARSKQPDMQQKDGSHLSKIMRGLRQVWEYLCNPGMRIILIITPILWFLQNVLYMGVILNANNFTSSDPFLYIALTGLMDGSAILFFTPIIPYFGRRTIVGFSLFIGGVLLFLDLFVSIDNYWVKWVMVMAGFFLVAGAFQVNFLYAPELFPTEARTRGFAFVNMVGNFGAMCTPFVTTMLAHYAWWAVGVTFGCSGIISSLMVPFLPETRNTPLPDTLQDVEGRRKAAKIKSRKTGIENKGYGQGESVI